MKRILSLIAAALIMSVFSVTSVAQSVKDIIGDKTGRYIYAQARDEDAEIAYELASDELASRVETYVGASKMKGYNKNWKEWIKRIVNEKYGLTRVFLYVSVDDLSQEAEKLSATRQEYVGSSKADEKKEGAVDVESPMEAVAAEAIGRPEEDVAGKVVEKPEETLISEVVEVSESSPASDAGPLSEEVAAPALQTADAFPQGAITDIIKRIVAKGINGDIASELSRGKNMRVISMYGNTRSKYLDHAYIVTDGGGSVNVYSPKDSEGKRVGFNDGVAVDKPAGAMIYWFLKK